MNGHLYASFVFMLAGWFLFFCGDTGGSLVASIVCFLAAILHVFHEKTSKK